jgi:catechol 2,3-dioxygenase-like lactoylglutathione lyase family enzyme
MRLTELTRFVEQVEPAVEFYTAFLGTDPLEAWSGGAVFDLGTATLLVHETYDPGPGGLPPDDHAAFAVDDVDVTCQRLLDAGLELERPPEEHDWGRSAYLRDPAGHLLEITAG